MTDGHVAVIPHTRSRSARATLAEEVGRRVPDLEVRATATPSETVDALAEASILLTMHLPDEWYGHLDSLEWVQALTAGVNHFDVDRLDDLDVVLTNASGVHATPIAEQVLGYMLMFERNLVTAVRQQERGVWERFRAGELADRTVGIVGLGAIGSAVAWRCDDLGMHVVGTKRDPSEAVDGVETIYHPDDLEEVLAVADYLVLACPLTPETRGLIDYAAIRVLPADAVVINIARGPVVVEDDLVRALQQGDLGGAALDVFEEEPLPSDSTLWDLSNVILTPHMAGSTPHYYERCAEVFAGNFEAFVAGDLASMSNRVL